MSQQNRLSLQPTAREANRDIVWMMLPLLAVACYLYGARPALLCLAAAVTALFCDHLVAWLRGVPYDRTENSSIPAVLVMVMLFPATIPYYVVVVCSMVVVLIGKAAFGGWGHYPFNPSALGYAVAAVSWPDKVFLYPAPFSDLPLLSADGVAVSESAAHALRAGGTPNVRALALVLGNYAGPIGTTAVLVLIACAMYLWMRRDISLSLPFGFLLACAAVAYVLPRWGNTAMAWPWENLYVRYQSVKYELLTGALIFASVFLINEPCTRPRNSRTHFVYGAALGFMTMMFRYFGTYDTGVCFAVLGINALSGFFDRRAARAVQRKEAGQNDA